MTPRCQLRMVGPRECRDHSRSGAGAGSDAKGAGWTSAWTSCAVEAQGASLRRAIDTLRGDVAEVRPRPALYERPRVPHRGSPDRPLASHQRLACSGAQRPPGGHRRVTCHCRSTDPYDLGFSLAEDCRRANSCHVPAQGALERILIPSPASLQLSASLVSTHC